MAPACWLWSFVVEGPRKGTMASVSFNDRQFNLSLYATGAFQAATPVLELRGGESV